MQHLQAGDAVRYIGKFRRLGLRGKILKATVGPVTKRTICIVRWDGNNVVGYSYANELENLTPEALSWLDEWED